jgi:ureidoglycolate dehydrogenase (NAD+)
MSGTGRKTIQSGALTDFSRRLLEAGGFSTEYARTSAELLVWANLRGADSHGVLRIPRYLEMVEQGIVHGHAKPHYVSERGATAVIEGDRIPGASGMSMATDKAIELAARFGLGMCSIMHTSHAGAIGYFAERAAAAGKIGIVMSASKPLMIYHGAKTEGVSTNPIAIGVPSADPHRSIVLDMSTAAVALGKIMAAKDAGKPIPEGWGVDANGAATTDPALVRSVLPMAGPKGSGLSLMIELLVSVLGANPLIATALTRGGDAGFNGTVIIIDPDFFPAASFLNDVADLGAAIKALPPSEETDSVKLPGERGYELAAKRAADGIPLSGGTATRLRELAERTRVEVPTALAIDG